MEKSPIGPYQLKTSPSGGARHSIEVYPVALRVDGIHTGIYHYAPREHQLALIRSAPLEQLASEAVGWFANQPWVADACVVFLMTSVLERSMWKYRHSHAYRVVLLDAGHLGQTFHIVCTALASIFRAAWLGRAEAVAGWLVGLIVVGGYDRSPGVAPVGRAFLGPVGSFVLSGQGQESRC